MLPCSWKETFGVECPSCGAQRSFDALVHGHVLESLQLFPALIPFICLVVFSVLRIVNPKLIATKWIIGSVILSGALMIINWAVKLF